ncbi:Prophage CP4-57 integrase [compost metagenome]
MRWSQIEGDEWVIPSGTMKKRRHHVVPLPKHAKVLLAMVRSMRPEGEGEYVFAAEHTPLRPISENAILALIGRMGYKGKMTGHGFRSVASTWAHKNGFPGEAIELQLSHAPKDKVASAYNRYEYIEVRRQMLKKWADWLLQAVPPRLAKAA